MYINLYFFRKVFFIDTLKKLQMLSKYLEYVIVYNIFCKDKGKFISYKII